MIKQSIVLLAAAAALSGCVDPQDYRTPLVEVETEKGIVKCQLYTIDRVWWDESVAHPASMTVEEADAICVEEGHRRKSSL